MGRVSTSDLPGALGPWLREADDPERYAELRSLASLAAVFVGSNNPVVTALRRAEQDDTELGRAYALLEALPSIPKRRLLATYLAGHEAAGGS
jgi:hypothetical protein